MLKTKNHSLTTALKQQGFTLLEMVLSTGLAALMMVAITASLLQFNKHKLLAQTVVQMQSQSQLAVAQVLRDWRSLCGVGVTSGTTQAMSLMRQYQGRCVQYHYAYNAAGHSLTRRKSGGRNSGFLAQVESMDLYYGVDSNKDCYIDQWRRSYQMSDLVVLHQVRVSLRLRVPTSKQLRTGIASLWVWHEDDDVVLDPVNFIWRLINVCA
tara:strand:+ start:11638 stop:12267 length:630 start_codon:yes stop_codon:yes gene_type:complete